MSAERRERGREVRRAVLGSAPSGAAGPASPVMQPYQELGLEVAWGAIWAREGISIKTRRFLTITLLTAQGRAGELEMHMRAALADGCTMEEIREVCLHTICYCGFPPAADALRILDRLVKEGEPAA